MIHAFAILLCCQLAGETITRATGVSLPGPVVGMILMVVLLMTVPSVMGIVQETAAGLLRHLSLLFVPAGTGVVAHIDRLGPDGPALLAALVVSTTAGLVVTVLTFAAVQRLMAPRGT